MSTYDKIALKIIQEQEQLIGPVAWNEASKVSGLRIAHDREGAVMIEENSDKKAVLDSLVKRYASLFGQAAQEVCKESVTTLIAGLNPVDVPASLR